MLGQEGEMCGC